MNDAEVYELLQGTRVLTIGTIVFIKPIYDKSKYGKTYRNGYQLAIKTPHEITVRGETLPIFITVVGKPASWHVYHIIKRLREPISVSGIRKVTKVYKNKKGDTERAIWVILKEKPIPTMVYLGKDLYSLIDN